MTLLESRCFLTSTALRYRGQEILDFAASAAGRPLFMPAADGNVMFSGHRVISTNFMPKFNGNKEIKTDRNVGTLHGMLCLHPRDFWLAFWGDMEVIVDRTSENLRKRGQVEFQFEQGVDMQPKHNYGVVGTLDFTNAIA